MEQHVRDVHAESSSICVTAIDQNSGASSPRWETPRRFKAAVLAAEDRERMAALQAKIVD
jgi:hypothetical protein